MDPDRATLVIAQDMLDHESEKPVLTTNEDIKSEMADQYYITRTYSLPAYLAYSILHAKLERKQASNQAWIRIRKKVMRIRNTDTVSTSPVRVVNSTKPSFVGSGARFRSGTTRQIRSEVKHC